MIIAFDIDDTITRHPAFFALVTDALIQAGHHVLIITYREDRETTAKDLRDWGIRYSKLICSTLDECLEHGVYQWKGAVCRKHGVEVFFEDDPDVIKHVDIETVCFAPRE